MDSSPAKEKSAPPGEKEKTSADPFASDIFAVAKTGEEIKIEIAAPEAKAEEKPAWIWRLPKVSRAIDWDALYRKLPADFPEDLPRLLAGALAKYLNPANKNSVEFLFFDRRETNETPPDEGDSWWARVGIEGSRAEFAVELDDNLAVWLVDALLGAADADGAPARDLTRSEIAVLEFLAVNLAHEANGIVKAPLFKFRGIGRQIPDWAARKTATDADDSRLVSTWQTVHGFQQSIVKIHLAPAVLRALQPDENKLLTAAPRRSVIWNALQNQIKEVRARIFFGAAQTSLAEVAGLETGDVILLEGYEFSVGDNGLRGGATIFLGDGEDSKIKGAFESAEIESPEAFEETGVADDNEFTVEKIKFSRVLRFSIKTIENLENPQFSEKFMPEETSSLIDRETEESFADEAAGGVSLENLAVTLRVELEARRLSLAEVGNLRVNQIIELGARATDPVNILIDDKIIARGELVEVEERLGVRIIQILR